MENPSRTATKRLFHVVVVVGMGTSVAAAGCSSSSGGPTDLGDAAPDVTAGDDAATAMEASQGDELSQGGGGDDAAGMDAAAMEASLHADACAGWAPCC